MKNYDAVIFDLDGTLLDTAEGIIRSVRHVIETKNLAPLSDDEIKTFIGPPIQRSFARIYGMSEEETKDAAKIFRDRYKGDDILLATPYEGIFETLRALSRAGVKTAVATYKRYDYALKLLVHYGFDKECDAICGSDPEGRLTKKDIILNAMEAVGVTDRKRAVMVGDSDNDAIGAAEIGMPFIGVTYGFGFSGKEAVEEFEHAGIAGNCEDILRCVL